MILLKSKLHAIRLQREDLAHMDAKEKYRIGQREELLFLPASDGFDFEVADYKKMSKWVDLLPITRYAKYLECGAQENSCNNFAHYGMVISRKDSVLLEEKDRDNILVIPGGECLYYYSPTIQHPLTEEAVMMEIADYVNEHHYEVFGTMCFFGTKILDDNGKKGQIISIPIKKQM